MVRDKKFREDLFHRLNVIQIRVPPLREHKSDIRKIADSYQFRQHRAKLTSEQVEALMAYDYPGNVRELLNLVERANVFGETDYENLLNEHRQMNENLVSEEQSECPDSLDEMTRLHVHRVYEKCGGNLTKAAEALEVSRNTVRKYLVSLCDARG